MGWNHQLVLLVFVSVGDSSRILPWYITKLNHHLGEYVFWTFFQASQASKSKYISIQKKKAQLWQVHMGVSKNRGTPKWTVYNGKPY